MEKQKIPLFSVQRIMLNGASQYECSVCYSVDILTIALWKRNANDILVDDHRLFVGSYSRTPSE